MFATELVNSLSIDYLMPLLVPTHTSVTWLATNKVLLSNTIRSGVIVFPFKDPLVAYVSEKGYYFCILKF